MQSKAAADSYDFYLPHDLNASIPPERRGMLRDQVRMMVLGKRSGNTNHRTFNELDQYLEAGDILVLNNSRTIPAVLKAEWYRKGTQIDSDIEIRLARKKSDSAWEALIVAKTVKVGDQFKLSETLNANVIGKVLKSPLLIVQFSLEGIALFDAFYSLGEPVRYEYINQPWSLDYYQTVFASQPGSVEMPSAGRAFSWELIYRLKRKGVQVVFLQLHTGLSYLLDDDYHHSPDQHFEEYVISKNDMDVILSAKASGGKVIAVGTTVVRALETAAATDSLAGWTNLYITADYQLKVADGIITGFHEPKASHLDMLTAFVDEEKLFEAYREAIQENYLWHEFGDINLII
ncbi:S-adenosylmethionine:tRNA ribosyltransferase-isomerase [Mesobacillus subterraneus]|uniref:S-adenosylmethionine:tRNA ribosyltransferase-isomerase n=1 Tax=Mesobacillus subterraneus TaxID=285983 RepID=A0A3R9KSY6_9BACI|nr:S-adenosylmethionine:tRNA ribosyltransferase-isomerase [Mesobacillus subterraneus]RSD25387.1 S-adenosylmethionine:tRNA ribosyltransferase-isomerase [Mesobacillus subterraneus]